MLVPTIEEATRGNSWQLVALQLVSSILTTTQSGGLVDCLFDDEPVLTGSTGADTP